MRKLLVLLLFLPLMATAKIPVEEDIIRQTLDSESPYYYPNLMLRYQSGDDTMTEEDYHYLYYGYAYQDAYKPLNANSDMDKAMLIAQTVDFENPTHESLEKLISAVNDALVQDPLLLLCDEPIASLDPKSSRVTMEMLRWVADELGVACLVNLHQVDYAIEYSDRIIALKKGCKVFDGTPDELDAKTIAEIYGTPYVHEHAHGVDAPRYVGDGATAKAAKADGPVLTGVGA